MSKKVKCTPEILANFLGNIVKYGNCQMAAHLTGVGSSSTYAWRKKYPKFEELYQKARAVYQAKSITDRMKREVPDEWRLEQYPYFTSQLMVFDTPKPEPEEKEKSFVTNHYYDLCQDCNFSRLKKYSKDELLCYAEPYYIGEIDLTRPACRFFAKRVIESK